MFIVFPQIFHVGIAIQYIFFPTHFFDDDILESKFEQCDSLQDRYMHF